MTTLTATSAAESLPIGAPSSPASSRSDVVYREFCAARPIPLSNTTALGSLVRKYEADPVKAEYLARARQKIARELYPNGPETLSTLRLARGLSQARLADIVGTSQSHIARVELGRMDPSTDLVARIATALDVDGPVAFAAIRNQRAVRGQ